MSDALFRWFAFTFPGPEMREAYWLFPTVETLHFGGISLLFGGLGFLDLRLLGYFSPLSMKAVLALLPLVVFGFVVCLTTGWLFFSDNPAMYLGNPAFLVKMALILMAGVNAVWFFLFLHRRVAVLGPGDDTPRAAKVTAVVSMSLWIIILLLGRALPLFTSSTFG